MKTSNISDIWNDNRTAGPQSTRLLRLTNRQRRLLVERWEILWNFHA